MHPLITQIEYVLRNDYPAGYGSVYVGNGNDKHLMINDLNEKIGLPLPDLFYEYYAWLQTVSFPEGDVSAETSLEADDDWTYTRSLAGILENTEDWQCIQRDDPEREWKAGFVELVSWNSCYAMVIDTQGKVDAAGNLLYWDYKGGGEYTVEYSDFEHFLQTKLALLQQKLYFPPHYSNAAAYEDFFHGNVRERIDKLTRQLNGPARYINF